MKNENQAKKGKKLKFKMKKRKGRRRQNRVEEGNSEIWDLKYKNNKDLGIKMKKCNNNHHINQQADW